MNVHSITGDRTVVTEAIPSTPQFVSVKEAARYLGIEYGTVLRWIRRGDLPVADTPSRSYRIPISAITSRRSKAEYPIHLGPDWIERTEHDQQARLGVVRWLRLAAETTAELAALRQAVTA